MNTHFLTNFLTNYSVCTLVIAGILTVLKWLYNKFLANKIPRLFGVYLPFLLGIILNVAYDCIFNAHTFIVSENSLSAGLLSGSIASVIIAVINKIKTGESFSSDPSIMLIESIIYGYVENAIINSVSKSIYSLLDGCDYKVSDIVDILSENAKGQVDKNELNQLANLIINSINSLHNK